MSFENINIKWLLLIEEAIKRWYNIDILLAKSNLFKISSDKFSILFKASDCGLLSRLSNKICKSKHLTNFLLSSSNLPIPSYYVLKKGQDIVNNLDFPLVVKPDDRSCNLWVSILINDDNHLNDAINLAYESSDSIIIQHFVEGMLYRVFVLDNKVVAVTKLEPPFVVGDGMSTISQLIESENKAQYRWYDKKNPAYPIQIESTLLACLEKANLSLDTILPLWKKIFLRELPQLSLWGVTTNIPFNQDLFEDCINASKIIWLPWAGIDIISKDEFFSEYLIIEVNSQPDFKMHHYPVYGEPINIASMLLDFIQTSIQ